MTATAEGVFTPWVVEMDARRERGGAVERLTIDIDRAHSEASAIGFAFVKLGLKSGKNSNIYSLEMVRVERAVPLTTPAPA